MKKVVNLILCLALVFVVTACGSSAYEDGVYEGKFEGDNSSMSVEITLKENKIVDCKMWAYDREGQIKGENYGKGSSDANYQKAQLAVEAMKGYPAKLIETQNVEDIDAIAGATISLKEFREAVSDALKKAK